MAYKQDTICVQGGYRPHTGESRIPPIAQSTTYFYESTQAMADLFDLKSEGYFYSRLANPTVAAFEGKVAELEGGVAAIGCASGMSAITLLALTLCEAGDNIVTSSAIYGGSFNLFSVTLPKFGIEGRFFDPDAPAEEIEKLIDDKTKFIFTETVANPSIKILDFDKISAIAKKYGVLFVVDNTLATPILCRPFALGAHIVVHSSSKYLDGHAAALGGVIVDGGNFVFKGNKRYPAFNTPDESYHGITYAEKFGKEGAFITKCTAQLMRDFGAIQSPQNAFYLNLGLESLHVRMARHCENGQAVAEFLAGHPKVASVIYCGLPGDKYHALAEKYLPHGSCGVVSFELKGGREAASTFMKHLKLAAIETHVADARTCCLNPASSTHRQMTDEQLAAAGIPAGLVRMSCGLENKQDLIDDIAQALEQVK